MAIGPSSQHDFPASSTASSAELLPTTDGDAGPGTEAALAKAVRRSLWGLLPFLFFMAILTYLDRGAISFAAPPLKHDVGLDNASYGLGAGLFFVGYVLVQVPSNLVVVQLGAPLVLSVLVATWGLIAMGTVGIRNAAGFFVVRLLLGFAEGGTFPAAWYHLSRFHTPHELSLAYATVSSAASLSQVLGGPLAAGLLLLEGRRGLHGWQWLFLVEGALTAAYAGVLWLGLARSPERAWFLAPEQRRALAARQDAARSHAANKAATLRSMLAGFGNWRLLYLSSAWLLVCGTSNGMQFWVPLLLNAILDGSFSGHAGPKPAPPLVESPQDRAHQLAKLALLSAALFLPCGIVEILAAESSRRFKERRFHCAVPVLCSGVAFMLVPLAVARGGIIPGFIVLTVAAIGVYAIVGPVFSWPAVFLKGPEQASGIAFFNACGSCGGFIVPTVMGALSNEGDYTRPMYVLGAMDLVASAMFFCFGPRWERPPKGAGEENGGVEEGECEGGPREGHVFTAGAAAQEAAHKPSLQSRHSRSQGGL